MGEAGHWKERGKDGRKRAKVAEDYRLLTLLLLNSGLGSRIMYRMPQNEEFHPDHHSHKILAFKRKSNHNTKTLRFVRAPRDPPQE